MKKIIISIVVIGLLLTTSVASVNAGIIPGGYVVNTGFSQEESLELSMGQETEPYILIDDVYVDDDNTEGPWDGSADHPYQHIQDGIDAASSDDTVFVFIGIYNEDIDIQKSIKLTGQAKESTIIEGSVDITSTSSVKVSRFTVRDAISLVSSDYNTISYNTIENTGTAIWLEESEHNTIEKNVIINNADMGIFLYLANENTIFKNTICNNEVGIGVGASNNNDIIANDIIDNGGNGILVYLASSNLFYHNNLIRNGEESEPEYEEYAGNAYNQGGINSWSESGEGNYWDDYTGIDADEDGIGDTSYDIPGGHNKDNYPLMTAWEIQSDPPTKPTIDGETNGDVGTEYTYTAVSTDPNEHGKYKVTRQLNRLSTERQMET